MYEDWPETTKVLSAQLRNLRGGVPDVMKAFSGIAQTALAPKALDSKTKELIALGIGIAIRCDDCIAFHIKAALERGATPQEISDAGHGNLHGRWSVRDVCKPCICSAATVRS